MFINYIKIAWRNLIKQPFYSIINIAGLGLGLIAVFFIFLYVKDELSYDQYQEHIGQLYRLNFYGKLGDQAANTSASPGPAAPLFSEVFPEVKAACRIYTGYGDYTVKYKVNGFRETRVANVDSTFADLFTVHVLQGNIKDALSHKGNVVITESAALKYFGHDDPMNKTLIFENEKPFQVAAVIRDFPVNSHFRFNLLLPMVNREDGNTENWGSTNFHTYFLLREHTDIAGLSLKMNTLFVEKFKIILKQYLNSSWDEFTKQGNFARVELYPVHKIHLYSNLDEEIMPPGSISQVYIFSIIGMAVLLLACINFVNLSTARAAMRAREVGVRKTIGALKSALAMQFLSESILFSILAGAFALGFIWFLLPRFNILAGKALSYSMLFSPAFLVPILCIILLTGILAGVYPALYLSALQPARVLKGYSSIARKSLLRNGLVVFQFFISIVLIIGSVTIYRQVRYMQEKKLGFNKDQVLVINDAYLLGKNGTSFQNQLKLIPNYKASSFSNFIPGLSMRNTTSIIAGKVANPGNTVLVNNWWADHDFIKTMEIRVLTGRDFDRSVISDSTGVVVNETLAKSFGYPAKDILNKTLGLTQEEGKIKEFHVIGVVQDFNFQSLHHRIEPLVIFIGGGHQYMSIRLNTTDVSKVIAEIEALWQNASPGTPFEASFLDDRFQDLYQAEQKTGSISFVFSFLAIFIACIGLLGLATFTIQQRIKEIGIRKVLGASTHGIITLISKDFIVIIGLSICFAFPLAWYLMHQWLYEFEYRTTINIWVFITSGVGVLAMAILIVSLQSLRAAWMNPVKAIRVE